LMRRIHCNNAFYERNGWRRIQFLELLRRKARHESALAMAYGDVVVSAGRVDFVYKLVALGRKTLSPVKRRHDFCAKEKI